MKLLSESRAAWVYRAGMIVLSTTAIGLIIWLITILRDVRGPLPLRIEVVRALAQIALAMAALLLIQQVGLVARNLVRNIKGSFGGASIEVESHDAPAKVVTTTTTELHDEGR